MEVGEDADGVGDETSFGGDVRGIVESGESKAAVVAGDEMGVWDARDGAVGCRAVALADMAGILGRVSGVVGE